jgi:hypothetical protein
VPSPLSADLTLAPLEGDARTLEEWLTTFHLASVLVDPYTNESAWILGVASRVLDHFYGAGVRVNFVVTGDADDAREFLGPLAATFLTFTDPDRLVVKALGLERLPAFAFIRQDRELVSVAQGYDPKEWRAVCDDIARTTAWSRPTIPEPGDPTPYHGSPAMG